MSEWQHGGQQPSGWMWDGSAWVPEPRPGVIPLRPLGLGDILGGSFRTIRSNPLAMIGLAAAVMCVVETIRVVSTYFLLRGVTDPAVITASDGTATFHAATVVRFVAVQAIVVIVTLFATAFLAGALTAAVGPAVLGQTASARRLWREAGSLIGRLLGAVLLIAVVVFGVVVLCALPGAIVLAVGAAADNNPTTVTGVVLIVVGVIGGILAGAYLQISFSLATPIVMLEKLRVVEALRRSRGLVRGDWWRVLGITIVVSLIVGAVASAIALPLDLAGGIGNVFSNDPARQASIRALLFSGLGAFLGGALVQPFAASAVALLYVDRRMRTEGLHITLQQAAAAGTSENPAAPTA